MEHETSREHALDMAQANLAEAKRLLDRGKAALAAGEIDEVRLASLQRLFDAALDDVNRVKKDN